jgi:hypothetical protein
VLHRLAQVTLAITVILSMALAAAAWRLAQGPVQAPWLVPILQSAAGRDAAARFSLGGAAVAWEGFRGGLDAPIDIRLTDVVVQDAAGQRILAVPRATVALAPYWLLRGRPVPRAIALDGARLAAHRNADGSFGLDLKLPAAPGETAPGVPGLLRTLAAPVSNDGSTWGELLRLRLDDAVLSVDDRQLSATWQIGDLALDLHRATTGGAVLGAVATLGVAGVTTKLDADAALPADGSAVALRFRLAPVVPAALARAVPAASALAAVDAPLALTGDARLEANAAPAFSLAVALGPGTLRIGQGTLPILAAEARLAGTPAHVTATLLRLVAAPRPDGKRTTLSGEAVLTRGADALAATATLDLDRVEFADLPDLWPTGLGGPGTRPWIAANIPEGTAHDFHVALALTAPLDLSDATITRISGGGEGDDLTVHWLRPLPPLQHASAHLAFLDPDSIEITVNGAREAIGRDTITVRGGRVLLTALTARDQFADIAADLAGPVPAALGLLAQPRLGLLARAPIPLGDAAGQFAGRLTVSHLPLRDDVTMDAVQVRTALKLTGLRLAGIVAGRDLDQGALDLSADPDGLHLAGQATLAGIPAQLQADLDFRAGPPTQVQQSVSATGTVDTAQLATLGIVAAPYARGAAGVTAHYLRRRNQSGEIAVSADLAGMALTLDTLAWSKAAGRPAQADARVQLLRDRPVGIDRLEAEGTGLRLAASAGFSDGTPDLVRLDHLVLGDGTDLRGTLSLPHQPGEPWRADLGGRSIDASAMLKRPRGATKPAKPAQAGPPYVLDARLDQVVLGPDRRLVNVAAHAENDGAVLRRLDLSGRPDAGATFQVMIEPQGTSRRLSATAGDAGALLRALDVLPDMQGGRLTLTGSYDDTLPAHPLAGRAEIDDFRIRHAPALAKLLQAMTLYGLVDLMSGPGLGFSRLEAPFRLADNVLELHDGRAFSASLGMTAKGQIDLAHQALDMQGTIVPAYFFNSLLGDLPIVGRLFSPERGGGVFAATYTLRGPLEDPRVGVNPLAALTPGFLRGVFGLFDRSPNAP